MRKFIFSIFAILLASLYVHSADTDSANTNSASANSADADYSFDLRSERPEFVLVRKHKDLTVRTAEEPVKCAYEGYDVSTDIDFVDKSGRKIASISGRSGFAMNDKKCSPYCEGNDTLPREIRIDPPAAFKWGSKMPRKDRENLFKALLEFRDEIIDGDMTVSINCKPHKAEYKIKFRVRVVKVIFQ